MNLEQVFIGFLTTCTTGVGTYVIYMHNQRAKERKEEAAERQRMEERHERERKDLMAINQGMFNETTKMADKFSETVVEMSEENNKTNREMSNILAGIKTLLENQ